jgi:uncharacterized membrane protein YfhO
MMQFVVSCFETVERKTSCQQLSFYDSAAASCALWSGLNFPFHFDTRFVEMLSSLCLPLIERTVNNLGQSVKAAVTRVLKRCILAFLNFPFLSASQQTLQHGCQILLLFRW